jgi:hypothetical protein
MAINLIRNFFIPFLTRTRGLLSFYFSVTVDGNTVSGQLIDNEGKGRDTLQLSDR